MLDQQGKNATMTQRWLYAGLAWVAYSSLFIIALNHNEGAAGLTFRLTLGAVLLYTPIEAGLLAGLRREGQADRNIFADWYVKRHARKLAKKSAIADLESTARMRQIYWETAEKIYTIQNSQATNKRLREVETVNKLSKPQHVGMAKSTSSAYSFDKGGRKPKFLKQQALDKTLQILSENPTANPSEIATLIGKSRQTVYDYFSELEAAGKPRRNGSIDVMN